MRTDSRSVLTGRWRIGVLLVLGLVLVGCEIPRFTFSDPSSPLTRDELIGVWSAEKGDGTIEFLSDGSMTFRDIPGDVWNGGPSHRRVEGHGRWELCASKYPASKLICGDGVPGRVDALRIDIREVAVEGVREIRHGNGYFAITGAIGERVVWFHPDDYYNSDPRTKFTKQ
ncbi:hypothetical protein FB566_2042 [Stackebrandtia endophytica]|uniref:Lipoprotein n=1 Tax=Stackebrandtia endophytica TaxID=1496996 RepID=A0A543AV98_9ACTN|nr:hypothetical protein [Stackebrandtia endophytica]TQL76510.1 hypothetical protein FB566_2042 [Stackebrandtia endophytica]